MTLDDAVSGLIADIYAGASDSAIWQQVERDLLARTDSRFGLVTVVDSANGGYVSLNAFGPDTDRFRDDMRDYSDHVFLDDPTLRFGMAHPKAGAVSLLSVVSRSEFDNRRNPYINWHRDVMKAGDCHVRYTPPVDGLILGVSLCAKSDNIVHSDRDIALFDMLFGHMRTALRGAMRPPDFASQADARILLDARGRVLAVSPAAEPILARRDGLAIDRGELYALRAADNRRFAALARSAAEARLTGGSGGAMTVSRQAAARDYVLTITPLPHPPGPFAAFQPCIDVRIIDPDTRPAPGAAEQWAAAFGLTPAEARLAAALLDADCDLRKAGELCGVTYATARVQLSSVFRKTDTSGQAQLVRLLTRIAG